MSLRYASVEGVSRAFVGGGWIDAASGATLDVTDPPAPRSDFNRSRRVAERPRCRSGRAQSRRQKGAEACFREVPGSAAGGRLCRRQAEIRSVLRA